MAIRDRLEIWFNAEKPITGAYKAQDKVEEREEELTREAEGGGGESLPDGTEGPTDDTENRRMRNRISDNESRSTENRRRIIRIDERTAFIARIVFALFITFLGSVAVGLLFAILGL